MKKLSKQNHVIIFICSFFVIVMGISFRLYRYYPALVVTGEDSVGTWMSGFLLVTAAITSLFKSTQKGWYPWIILAAFFCLLALDERFMFHEQLKEIILFRYLAVPDEKNLLCELPAIIGSLAGLVAALLLWFNLKNLSRLLLVTAFLLGSISVVFDIIHLWVFWEESLKLLAELMLVCCLLVDK